MFISAQEEENSLVAYTDNCLLFCESEEELSRMIAALKSKFQLSKQDEGKDIFAHLGIESTF